MPVLVVPLRTSLSLTAHLSVMQAPCLGHCVGGRRASQSRITRPKFRWARGSRSAVGPRFHAESKSMSFNPACRPILRSDSVK